MEMAVGGAPRPGALVTLLAWLIVLLMLAGCAAVEKDRRAVRLQAATYGYQTALRWGSLETALGFLHPDRRSGQVVPESFKNLRVIGYEVLQPPIMQADGSATQTVIIDYLFEDTQVVRRVTDRQTWRWDEQVGAWWLDSGLPALPAE
jgi:hypothetical protein